MSAYSFAIPSAGWLWNRPERTDLDDVPGEVLWRGGADSDSHTEQTMPSSIQPFDLHLLEQMDNDDPDVRRCAWRASTRGPALRAMHERRGEFPTFADYAVALGIQEPEMLHALGVTWWAWRNVGNAS